ncbi:MAG: hypothetical protein WC449_02390 [Candidatus Paceibacterota bacterium]
MQESKKLFEADLQEAIVKGNASSAIVNAKLLHRDLSQNELIELGVHALFSRKVEAFCHLLEQGSLKYNETAKNTIWLRLVAAGEEKSIKNFCTIFEGREISKNDLQALTSPDERSKALSALGLKNGVEYPKEPMTAQPNISELGEIITP